MAVDPERPLPFTNPPVARQDIVFSHPSEAELARVLDYYGIAWRYEPVTFPLQWDSQGALLEAFSPDFYLVDQDLYVELTTLRSKLMRIKRRKIKRIQELYPEVSIKLWNRKDFIHFLERFGLQDRQSILVGQEALDNANGQ